MALSDKDFFSKYLNNPRMAAAEVLGREVNPTNPPPPVPACINHTDIPTRYLRPFTRWVWDYLPQVGEPRDPGVRNRRWARHHTWVQEQRAKWVEPLPIKAFAYYLKTEPAAEDDPCEFGDIRITYREPGQPRMQGDLGEHSHLNIYIPPGKGHPNTANAEWFADLKLRLYVIVINVGAKLEYFGRESLPDGPMPMHRQRVGKLWMENADTLLAEWKELKDSNSTEPNPHVI